MDKAVIAIGVNQSGALPALAASDSANTFAAWAKSQGFACKCLTDEKSPVTLKKIKSAVNGVLTGGCRQLLIYFSGHGIFRGPNYEQWLLSGAPDDPDEAVNLPLTMEMSRNLPLQHVVFISDACRSVAGPQSPQLSQINGGVIVPNRDTGDTRPDVDVFYAALPGQPALEVQLKTAVKNYRAVFTSCLMKGLSGGVPGVIEVWGQKTVIPSWTLKPYLSKAVPKSAAAKNIKLRQVPEVRVESHPPLYLAEIKSDTSPHKRLGRIRAPRPARGPADSMRSFESTRPQTRPPVPSPVSPLSITELQSRTDPAFQGDIRHLVESQARQSFDTHTGFTVIGQKVRRVVFPGAPHDLQESNLPTDERPRRGQPPDQHIRIHPPPQGLTSSTALIELENGHGTCLAVLPGFVGAVVVKDGVVSNVSYTPSQATSRYQAYLWQRADIDNRRAFAAAASERGSFNVDRESARQFSNYLRKLKQFDPTLGLYAAYAYFQGGLRDDVRSVYDFMLRDFRNDRTPVLFDVALLAGSLSEIKAVAPSCPLLTQGWALLGKQSKLLHPLIRRAGRYLIPSLWTTFSPEGVALVRDALRQGVKR